jgi:hypothetical protein
MEQVKKLGLALDATHVEDGINPNFKATFDNTPTFPFNIGKPNIREVTDTFTDLHESVKQRWQSLNLHPPYRPTNLMKFKEYLDS